MHEISPVLSSKFDAPDYVAAKANFNLPATDASNVSATSDTAAPSPVDDRRYTKFDRTASNAGSTTTFSFSDFLDMVNPLEHIPGVSSIYREVTGESINPVSRVAGDIAFSGPLGLASMIVSGIGAIADSALEQETGKDAAGTMVAALFGNDKTQTSSPTTQLAAADATQNSPATPPVAVAQAPAPTASAPAPAPQPSPDIKLAAAPNTSSDVVADAASTTGLGQLNRPGQAAKAFPLDRTKLAYGGVMAQPGSMGDQNMVMGLAEASHTSRMGSTIYTNRFMNGPHPLASAVQTPPAASVTAPPAGNTTGQDAPAQTVASTAPVVSSQIAIPPNAMTPAPNAQAAPLPQALMDDMVMMKALDQYRSLGAATPVPGTQLDLTN